MPDAFELFCDGSMFPHLPTGGWAFILRDPAGCESWGQGEVATRNNCLLEFLAVVEGLRALPEGRHRVVVHTDAQVVIERSATPPKRFRPDTHPLYEDLRSLCARHEATFVKVGDKSPHPIHARAHYMARVAARRPTAC